jgi:hypothetical protein
MPRFTEEQYRALLAKGFKNPHKPGEASFSSERELQQAILADAKQKGWIAFYNRMDRKSTSVVGTPDITLAMAGGRTLFLECKSRGGKVSTEQAATIAWLRKLAHRVEVVSSFQEYLEAIK